MNKLILVGILLSAGGAQAGHFTERTKVVGFQCDSGRAGIRLRSIEQDRLLYLAKNLSGKPVALSAEAFCPGLIKNLSSQFSGKVLEMAFDTETYMQVDQVYIEPKNPCRPGHTKCDEFGTYVPKEFTYFRVETVLGDYRFFSETRF